LRGQSQALVAFGGWFDSLLQAAVFMTAEDELVFLKAQLDLTS
jgi:hypothetical protein